MAELGKVMCVASSLSMNIMIEERWVSHTAIIGGRTLAAVQKFVGLLEEL